MGARNACGFPAWEACDYLCCLLSLSEPRLGDGFQPKPGMLELLELFLKN